LRYGLFFLVFLLLSTGVCASVQQTIEFRPPFELNITSVSFDEGSRQLSVGVVAVNGENELHNNLYYVLSLYHGDELSYEGDVFKLLEYMVSYEGEFAAVGASETVDTVVLVNPSVRIPRGNYFLRLFVLDDRFSPYGSASTKKPVFLSGNNDSILPIRAFVRSPYGDALMMEGHNVTANDIQTIIIPLEENPSLAEKLAAGEEFYLGVSAFNTGRDRSLVHEYPQVKLVVDDEFSKTWGGHKLAWSPVDVRLTKGSIVKYDVVPWEGIKPGPYDLELTTYDASGESVMLEPAIMRLLIEGFMARINGVTGEDGFYKKGESLNLRVSVTCWSTLGSSTSGRVENAQSHRDLDHVHVVEDGLVEVILHSRGGRDDLSFTKEIELVSADDIGIDISDYSMPSDFLIESIEVVLRLESDGSVLDSYSLSVADVDAHEYSPPVKRRPGVLQDAFVFFSVLIVLIFVVYVIIKRRGDGN